MLLHSRTAGWTAWCAPTMHARASGKPAGAPQKDKHSPICNRSRFWLGEKKLCTNSLDLPCSLHSPRPGPGSPLQPAMEKKHKPLSFSSSASIGSLRICQSWLLGHRHRQRPMTTSLTSAHSVITLTVPSLILEDLDIIIGFLCPEVPALWWFCCRESAEESWKKNKFHRGALLEPCHFC